MVEICSFEQISFLLYKKLLSYKAKRFNIDKIENPNEEIPAQNPCIGKGS